MFLIRIFGYLALACLTLATPVSRNTFDPELLDDTAHGSVLHQFRRLVNHELAHRVSATPQFHLFIVKAVENLQESDVPRDQAEALGKRLADSMSKPETAGLGLVSIKDAVFHALSLSPDALVVAPTGANAAGLYPQIRELAAKSLSSALAPAVLGTTARDGRSGHLVRRGVIHMNLFEKWLLASTLVYIGLLSFAVIFAPESQYIRDLTRKYWVFGKDQQIHKDLFEMPRVKSLITIYFWTASAAFIVWLMTFFYRTLKAMHQSMMQITDKPKPDVPEVYPDYFDPDFMSPPSFAPYDIGGH
ncbi:hypothetical protein CXG81DRAFT_21562 [Caulochytrium protostelioides]|uniref:Uncharacterized protein n=1 Tax=Caulochytrium protostelioides TaxID=1555241 RepID=A0A4P9WZT7_9FUNG|nr:hypothetical protein CAUPRSCDRAFT_12673 [Caulochytrium protostelioides]RKO98192.1 hypothetical protein CXG81DRAFT_21562 [Caulochytrium protostelioides]|eukprot:RKO98192.1 hypothetical protein CXG81DRAFT_21562 [Caulochytrium protostelioides]